MTGVNATGPQVLKALRTSTNAPTGVLRLKVTAVTRPVTFTLRADLLLKQQVATRTIEWVWSTFMSLATAGSWVMPVSRWFDVSGFVTAYLLCEFRASSGSGSNLSRRLQTAPCMTSDDGAWGTVGGGSGITLGTSSATYDGSYIGRTLATTRLSAMEMDPR